MHPDLTKAIVLAPIVRLPDSTKRQLISKLPERRERGEEVLAASIAVALPPNAYREFVQQGRAVAAIAGSDGELVGYCLYGGVFPQAKIFQTYVAPNFRGQAIGERLLTTVLEGLEQKGFLSAVANVAADLSAANRFYEKMGFDVVATKEGGKTTKRLIKVRAKELSSPSLLDLIDQPTSQARAPVMRGPRPTSVPRYVLDLNVIFDVTKMRPRSEVAQGVVAAALENDVKLAITAEITAELEKHSRKGEPDPILNLCRAIPTLRLPDQKTLLRLRDELLPIVFPEKAHQTTLKANDEADLRHLATAIEENVVGFITSDEAILRAADKLNARYNLSILSPSTFGQGFEAEFGARPRAFIHTASSTLQPTSFEEQDREAIEQLLRSYHLSDVRITEGATIWLYCKAPVASISAVCQLRHSETLSVADLWAKHSTHLALSKSEYDDYLEGRDTAHALVLSEVRSLDNPIDLEAARALRLNFQPPQFFMHLRPGCELKERLLMAAG